MPKQKRFSSLIYRDWKAGDMLSVGRFGPRILEWARERW